MTPLGPSSYVETCRVWDVRFRTGLGTVFEGQQLLVPYRSALGYGPVYRTVFCLDSVHQRDGRSLTVITDSRQMRHTRGRGGGSAPGDDAGPHHVER